MVQAGENCENSHATASVPTQTAAAAEHGLPLLVLHLAPEHVGEARAGREQQRHGRGQAAEQRLRDLHRRAEARRG